MNTTTNSSSKLFIVLARPRTGSTLLVSYLNSHPEINTNGEVLSKLNGLCHRTALRNAFTQRRKNAAVKAMGFKLFYDHPFDSPDNALFETLSKLPDLHVIHLKRRNLLRCFVSRKIAHADGKWLLRNSSQGKSAEEKRLRINASELSNEFQNVRNWEQKCDRYFLNHPMIALDYEYLSANPKGAFAHVCDFLGVDNAVATTSLIRQNPEPLPTLVENYSELKQAFASTEWNYLFDE